MLHGTAKLAVASGQSDDTSNNKSLHQMTVPASNTAEVEVCVEPSADGKLYNPPAKRGDCLGRLERNVTPPGHKIYRVPAFFLCIATLLGFGPSVVARAIHGVWYMNVWLRDWYNPRLMLLELHALTGLASLALMCIQVGRRAHAATQRRLAAAATHRPSPATRPYPRGPTRARSSRARRASRATRGGRCTASSAPTS